MGAKVITFVNDNHLEVQYKNINIEEPEDQQPCVVTDGKGFYEVMIWQEKKGWDCPWNKGYYKINFWTPLPFIANQKDMLKEQVDIEVDKLLMKGNKI